MTITWNKRVLFHQMDDGDTKRNTASFHILGKSDRGAEASASLSGKIENGGDGTIRSAPSKLQD